MRDACHLDVEFVVMFDIGITDFGEFNCEICCCGRVGDVLSVLVTLWSLFFSFPVHTLFAECVELERVA